MLGAQDGGQACKHQPQDIGLSAHWGQDKRALIRANEQESMDVGAFTLDRTD